MKKDKTPEFPPELLATIAPEKREDFKRIARKKRYLRSGLFLCLWHLNLMGLSFPVVIGVLKYFDQVEGELNNLFSIFGGGILSFFVAIILGYMTRDIRSSLNQIGLNVTHGTTIALVFFYGAWWWFSTTPYRSY